jgi:hypothetical protein
MHNDPQRKGKKEKPMLSLRHRKLPLVLALGACFVVACKTHVPTDDDELNKPGQTTTTSAAAESTTATTTTSGTETTGAPNDPGNVQSYGGGADLGTTQRGSGAGPGGTAGLGVNQGQSISSPADEPMNMRPMSPPGGLVIGSDYPVPVPAPTRPDLNDMGLHDPPTNAPAARSNETRGARDGGAAPTPPPKPKANTNTKTKAPAKRVMP